MFGPIRFEPIFFPRVWGGRALELFEGKNLRSGEKIGESWELVDRPEAQSYVRTGPWRGRSLHDLWVNERTTIFSDSLRDTPRFPLLLKLLDCREILSLQVHPPEASAMKLGGESKTEAWYIVRAEEGARLCLGAKAEMEPRSFADAIQNGTVADCVESRPTRAGELYFVPSGQVHAIGAGNLIFEVQQNSDTTYRVFDWNRTDEKGNKRELHVEAALQSIDFVAEPPKAEAEHLVADDLFEIRKVAANGELAPFGQFAVGFVARGEVQLAGEQFKPGELFLLPAQAPERDVALSDAELVRVTIPRSSKKNSAR